ncbi:MAG: VOC family protein [Phaeodactylibacter sp.]|nr:VOC family protein [Phaeodactylibacter sp.]
MKPAFQGLRTVAYKVGDIERARDWYAEILGFPPYFDEPFYVGFNVGGYELGLQPAEGEPAGSAENVVAYWGVEDAESSYQRLLGLGAAPHEAPSDVGSGIVVASVKDPWGNVFGIIFNPHFKVDG